MSTVHRLRLPTELRLALLVLGAGIALAGQIFHLEEHWPGDAAGFRVVARMLRLPAE